MKIIYQRKSVGILLNIRENIFGCFFLFLTSWSNLISDIAVKYQLWCQGMAVLKPNLATGRFSWLNPGLGICSTVFWANRTFFAKKMSEWAIRSKKRVIRSFNHFWWATWAIRSHRSFLVKVIPRVAWWFQTTRWLLVFCSKIGGSLFDDSCLRAPSLVIPS